jgi:hypothetical protein
MKYTQFVFYANTPFMNAAKTIHFRTNEDRDRFFDEKMSRYEILKYGSSKFNMVRSRLVVSVDWRYDYGPKELVTNGRTMIGVNYCYFYDSNTNQRIYCQVVKTEYVNDKVTNFYLSVDILMTYFQGDFTNKIGHVHVRRQHLTKEVYKKNMYFLANNDKLRISSPQTIHQKYKPIGASELVDDTHEENKGGKRYKIRDDDMWLVFQCSVDLSADFGDIDEPKMKTSKGSNYDRVISPVSLYVMSLNDGLKLFDYLGDYPWISQNIKNITMIPRDFIDETDLLDVQLYKQASSTYGVKRFKNTAVSSPKPGTFDSVEYMFTEINRIVSVYTGVNNIIGEEPHLYNSGYFIIRVSNWAGSSVDLMPEKLIANDQNLTFNVETIIGYDNKVAVIPHKYNSNGENLTMDSQNIRISVRRGDYLNAAIMYSSWDTLPIMIDNYKLSLSSSAYSRKLTEDTMMSNQIDNLMNGGSEDMPWWESAMRVGGTMLQGTTQAATTGFATGGIAGATIAATGNTLFNGFNQFVSEKQYYRQLKAQQNQAKLNSPTVTNQNMGNSFGYKNGTFGLSVKIYAGQPEEIVTAYKYHKNTGYQWDRFEVPNSIMSMSHVNYLEIDGEWYMDDVPVEFMKIAKDMFKQGVSFYHNPNGVTNPFNEDISKNTRVL